MPVQVDVASLEISYGGIKTAITAIETKNDQSLEFWRLFETSNLERNLFTMRNRSWIHPLRSTACPL
jgi:hypothetical protein